MANKIFWVGERGLSALIDAVKNKAPLYFRSDIGDRLRIHFNVICTKDGVNWMFVGMDGGDQVKGYFNVDSGEGRLDSRTEVMTPIPS